MADSTLLFTSSMNGTAPAVVDVSPGPFDAVDYDRALATVRAAFDKEEARRLRFLMGDHYGPNGEDWVGPFPRNGDRDTLSLYDSELKREFISQNVASEIVWRHVMAAIGRESVWGATPQQILNEPAAKASDAEKAAYEVEKAALDADIARHDSLLRDWWDDTRSGVYTDRKGRLKTCSAHSLLQRAALRMAATERAVLRVFIPSGERDANGNLPKIPIPESLQRIHVELCDSNKATVHIDRDSMNELGIVLWTERPEINGTPTTINKAEICYLDDMGRTVLRIVSDTQAAAEDGAAPLDLMGALLHLEMGGDSILTDTLLAQQKDINRRLTMSGRVSNMAGFPERTLLNAQLDGKYVADPNAPDGSGKRFVAEPPSVGPSAINNFRGITVDDDKGGKMYVPASYEIHEPTGSDTYDNAVEAARARMLHEAHQTHALISGDATASGVSREQARHEFIRSLGGTVAELNRCGRWLLPTVLLLAITTSSEQTYRPYDSLHFMFECKIDAGPRDANERMEDRNAVKDAQLSLETGLARGGVDDVDAEMARIKSEQEGNLNTVKLKSEILQLLSAVPVELDAGAQIAGFDAAQKDMMVSSHQVMMAGDTFKPPPAATGTPNTDNANAQTTQTN